MMIKRCTQPKSVGVHIYCCPFVCGLEDRRKGTHIAWTGTKPSFYLASIHTWDVILLSKTLYLWCWFWGECRYFTFVAFPYSWWSSFPLSFIDSFFIFWVFNLCADLCQMFVIFLKCFLLVGTQFSFGFFQVVMDSLSQILDAGIYFFSIIVLHIAKQFFHFIIYFFTLVRIRMGRYSCSCPE